MTANLVRVEYVRDLAQRDGGMTEITITDPDMLAGLRVSTATASFYAMPLLSRLARLFRT